VTLSLTDENFGKLIAGKHKAQTLFMSGKLKIRGNVMKGKSRELASGLASVTLICIEQQPRWSRFCPRQALQPRPRLSYRDGGLQKAVLYNIYPTQAGVMRMHTQGSSCQLPPRCVPLIPILLPQTTITGLFSSVAPLVVRRH
jgi:hypothetical protein